MICFLAAWHVVVHREATVESTVAAVTLGQLLVLLLLLMKISFKPVASFLSYRLGQSPLHHGPLIPSWRRDSNSANIVAVTIFFGHKSIFFFWLVISWLKMNPLSSTGSGSAGASECLCRSGKRSHFGLKLQQFCDPMFSSAKAHRDPRKITETFIYEFLPLSLQI